ncbi:hypothetical protein FHS89_001670 [Rubricella aquisinus]|uniref:Copper chaperone PCu(A)C n=1 Tax=Rubricella aquisinus TaxID=2028108 RepID=A0A840WKN3_9RHOB|nr:copper chaperone PCu(A)C [Rubricella aquisinus]MBB5515658.1 hypothetical protein [Rubricella aquisinus]
MKTTLIALALGLASAMPALAHDYRIGDLTIDHPWARETTPMARASGGFMTITNTGDRDERLLSASADFARAELHITVTEDGVNRMMEQEDGIVIPAGGTLEFKPGSYHVMFMGLTGPFIEGEEKEVTLIFERAGQIDVLFTVEPFQGGGHTGHMNH